MKTLSLLSSALLPGLVFIACSRNDFTQPTEPQTVLIDAVRGGQISLEDGTRLVIPGGALANDTEISVESVPGSDFDEFGINGVHIEPAEVGFQVPATVSFPLPAQWGVNELPTVYIAEEMDPSDFLHTEDKAPVTGGPGNYTAEVEVKEGGIIGIARNCHAGSVNYLLRDFESAGCDTATMAEQVNEACPGGFRVEPYDKDPEEVKLDDVSIQCFLNTYFIDYRAFNEGQQITQSFLDELRDLMEIDGKQIVLGFNSRWKDDNSDGIYEGFAHSAVLEIKDGELKLRQSVSVNDDAIEKVREAFQKNRIYYPLQGELTAELLNAYREAPSGVLIEEAVCGSLGCIWDIPLERRSFPYRAVRFYVSHYGQGDDPCNAESEFTMCEFNMELTSVTEFITWNNGNTSTRTNQWTAFGGTYEGSLADNIFTGTRQMAGENSSLSANLTVILSPDRQTVSSLQVTYSFTGIFSSERMLTASNIPAEAGSTNYFIVSGPESCDHIQSFESTTVYDDRTVVITDYECVGGEFLEVFLFN